MEASNYFKLTLIVEEELVAISTDRGLIMKYHKLSLETFWVSVKHECFDFSFKFYNFSAIYLRELGISTLFTIENKKQETLECTDKEM